ncbi:hypothetical protein CPB83DRAFT_845074, partial [Crepidotus variabilis]
MAADGHLLATFFFSKSDNTRDGVRSFVASIAYQVIMTHPSTQQFIESVILQDPMIFDKSLDTQLVKLVTQPLLDMAQSSGQTLSPQVIIVDGLDECRDRDAQSGLLSALFAFSKIMNERSFPIRIIIASRPEQHLLMAFNDKEASQTACRLPLNDSISADNDIQIIFLDKFQEIKSLHPLKNDIPVSWPEDRIISKLVQKSSGQFIYASIAVKFISSPRHSPISRLEIILGVCPPTRSRDIPFAELDAIYSYIFSSLDNVDIALQILGVRLIIGRVHVDHVGLGVVSKQPPKPGDAFALANTTRKVPIPPQSMICTVDGLARLLRLDISEARLALSNLSSVVDCLPSGEIIIQHASLVDFLQDPARSQNLYIDDNPFFTQLVNICLDHVDDNVDQDAVCFAYFWLQHGVKMVKITEHLASRLNRFSFIRAYEWFAQQEPDKTKRRRESLLFWSCMMHLYYRGSRKLQSSDRHRKHFDTLLLQTFTIASANPEITCLISGLVAYRQSADIPFFHYLFPLIEALGFDDPRADWAYGDLVLTLSEYFDDFKDFLREFFSDPSRHQDFVCQPEIFTQLSIRCFKYLFGKFKDEFDNPPPGLIQISNDHGPGVAVGTVLPIILQRSQPHEELVFLLTSEHFHSNLRWYFQHPDITRGKLVKPRKIAHELVNYLQRCESKSENLHSFLFYWVQYDTSLWTGLYGINHFYLKSCSVSSLLSCVQSLVALSQWLQHQVVEPEV